jgi:hypothetical protein
VKLTVLVSYDLGLHFLFDLLVMEGDDEPLQAAQAATTVATALKEDRKKRKLERLKREAKAAQRKALASKRLVDEESRKRSRAKSNIGSYFATSRNANNRIGALHLPEPKECTSRQGCHKGRLWRKITVRTSFSSGRPRTSSERPPASAFTPRTRFYPRTGFYHPPTR